MAGEGYQWVEVQVNTMTIILKDRSSVGIWCIIGYMFVYPYVYGPMLAPITYTRSFHVICSHLRLDASVLRSLTCSFAHRAFLATPSYINLPQPSLTA